MLYWCHAAHMNFGCDIDSVDRLQGLLLEFSKYRDKIGFQQLLPRFSCTKGHKCTCSGDHADNDMSSQGYLHWPNIDGVPSMCDLCTVVYIRLGSCEPPDGNVDNWKDILGFVSPGL